MRVSTNAAHRVHPDQQNDLTMRYPDRRFDVQLKVASPAICSRCHSYLEQDHWRFGEQRYRELKEQPETHVMLCPGCTRVERRLYEGEVTIHHQGNEEQKQDMIHLIHNEEARARITNPTARIALLEDREDELYLLTTTQFLAKRIARELQKAFRGQLKVDDLPRERFVRVRWTQAA